jgi:3-oxoacyl-[acyl-carrier-protein] synthase II
VALAETMTRGMARFGLTPRDVDCVLSGASGSRGGDRLEAAVLRRLFGDSPPPVVAPKGVTGEYGGAWTAAALTVLAGGAFAATAGFAEVDRELGLVPHDGSPLGSVGRVLALALAAGGGGAWVILERPSP